MKLQAGDVLFINSGTVIGKLVTWGTEFRYTHVAVALDSEHVMDIRAFKKSSVVHIDELKIIDYVIKRPKDKLNLQTLKNVFVDCSYKPYDYKAVFKLLLKIKFKMKIPRASSYDTKSLYCSEFIDYLFCEMNIDLVEGCDTLVSIEDLYHSDRLEEVEYGNKLSN